MAIADNPERGPLTEVLIQYGRDTKRHYREGHNDPRNRPELWLVAIDPIEILQRARKAELTTPTPW